MIFFHDDKDFEIYYDSLEECLENFSSTTEVAVISPTQSTMDLSSIAAATTETNSSVAYSSSIVTTIATTTTTTNVARQMTSTIDHFENSETNDEELDTTTLIILLAGLPSFALGAFASGAFIYVYLRRRLIASKASQSTKNLRNVICRIRRRRKKAPKETVEEKHSKIEETISTIEEKTPKIEKINPEIEEFIVTDTEETPKRSNIKNILDSWKSASSKKKSEGSSKTKSKVKTTKVTHFSMFDDFKDSNHSNTSSGNLRTDLIESRKFISSLNYYVDLITKLESNKTPSAQISQSMSPESNIINLDNGFNSSDQLTPESQKSKGKIRLFMLV